MLYTQVRRGGVVALCVVDTLRCAIPLSLTRLILTQLRATLSQETCLYSRLNAALRDHDMRALEPFLPYMKLLLSGLYHLPLVHLQTWRGVKLELYKVRV